MIVVFVILAVAVVLFLTEALPPDLIALMIMASTVLFGVLPLNDALLGFANPAIATIAAMFVLSEGLTRTGAVAFLGDRLLHLAGGREWRVVLATMLVVGVASAFINNTPVVVLFVPILLKIGEELTIPASKLLIPLSYAAIIGGTCTLLGTSTNILVADLAEKSGLPAFGIFELAKFGLILSAVGLVYMMTIGRWLLPVRQTVTGLFGRTNLREYLTEVVVRRESPWVGERLDETEVWQNPSITVVQLIRQGVVVQPKPDTALQVQDLLLIQGNARAILKLHESGALRIDPLLRRRRFESHEAAALSADVEQAQWTRDRDADAPMTLAEVVVPPNSPVVHMKLGDLNLYDQYGIYLFAHMRREHHSREALAEMTLEVGDILLVQGPTQRVRRLAHSHEFLVVESDLDDIPVRKNKAPIAIGLTLLVVVLASLNLLSIGTLAISGAILLVLFGCISLKEAYDAIDWSILVLIGGTLALGRAMETSNAARVMAEQMIATVGVWGPVAVLSGFYFMTNALTEVMTNNAAAILMVPIALAAAQSLGVDPRPFFFAIMFAASASFSTPIGYQTNTFIYGPGGYRFLDFMRVGLPLNITFWVLATLMIPYFWPFTPA